MTATISRPATLSSSVRNPMPRESETTAMRAKLGDFARVRTAKRKLAGNLIQTIYGKEGQSFPLCWQAVVHVHRRATRRTSAFPAAPDGGGPSSFKGFESQFVHWPACGRAGALREANLGGAARAESATWAARPGNEIRSDTPLGNDADCGRI